MSSVPEPRAGRREWLALAALSLPLLFVSMDVAILYFAAPFISQDLRATATEQLWIFDIYGFVLAGLLMTMGSLGDRIGRRRLLFAGATAFGVVSLLASQAQTAEQLIAARALLGVAGATLMPATLGIIRDLFRHSGDRARAIAVWSAVMAGGVSLGPVLSGLLLERYWWGSVFVVNVPAMALLLVVGPLLLPATAGRRTVRFDVAGSALSLAAVMSLVYGIKRVATDDLDAAATVALGLGLLTAVAFVVHQQTARHPMLDLRLFASRVTGGALLTNLLVMATLVGNALFLTQYLQLGRGMSPLTAALWSLAPSVVVAAAAPAAAALVLRIGRAPVITAGLLVASAGFVLLSTTSSDSPLAIPLVAAGIIAAGLVATLSVLMDAVVGGVEPERASTASAVSEATAELGGSLGVAVLGSIGAAVFQRSLADRVGPSVLSQLPTGADESLATALGAAAALPTELAARVATTAQGSFLQAMEVVDWTAALLLVLGGAFTWFRFRPADAGYLAEQRADATAPPAPVG